MTITAPDSGMYITTPGNWVALDLEALSDERRAGDLVDERAAELPGLAPHRDELVALLARSTAAARDAGVAFAAVMLDTRADETPLLASLTVAVVAWPGGAPVAEPGLQTVALPAGEASRLERVHPTALVAGGAELLVLTTQYLVVTPGSGTLTVLTFTSPSVLERESLSATFQRIAETLELPTHMNEN